MDIELQHIHKRFGAVHANNDISAHFRGGRIVGVLGENGAGKSTLMKILSGYQPADSGAILLDGARADYHNPQGALAAGIGMLQQDPLDVGAFTVVENFAYGARGAGWRVGRGAARAKLLEQCARFGFQIDPDAPAATLSIGQRQQLEIARLLASGVKALILDEPTTGISAEQKVILFDALRQLARDDGMSVLLVSHKLEDVIALCDEVVVLRAGRVVGRARMPLSVREIVRMMFGGDLPPPPRERVTAGAVIAALERVTLRDTQGAKRVTISDFSLQLRAGEVVGVAGLEHSGQELLLRGLAGLIKPFEGQIVIDGTDLTGQPYRAFRAAGVSFGAAGRLEEGLIAGLTLTEHLALVRDRRPVIDWRAARTLTERQIARYHVRGRPDSPIETLSGGNQQRVLMALLPETPRVLVLEQPTRGLDVDSARWIWSQLLERRATADGGAGAAILFTSPDLDEIVTYSDRIIVAFAGRLVEVPKRDAMDDAARVEQLGQLIGGDFSDVSP
jgi:simple sugar transport system ATP-binding protein